MARCEELSQMSPASKRRPELENGSVYIAALSGEQNAMLSHLAITKAWHRCHETVAAIPKTHPTKPKLTPSALDHEDVGSPAEGICCSTLPAVQSLPAFLQQNKVDLQKESLHRSGLRYGAWIHFRGWQQDTRRRHCCSCTSSPDGAVTNDSDAFVLGLMGASFRGHTIHLELCCQQFLTLRCNLALLWDEIRLTSLSQALLYGTSDT